VVGNIFFPDMGLVTFRRFSSFVVAVQYTLPVVLHILRVDSNDKGTGYASGSIVVVRVSWDTSRWDL